MAEPLLDEKRDPLNLQLNIDQPTKYFSHDWSSPTQLFIGGVNDCRSYIEGTIDKCTYLPTGRLELMNIRAVIESRETRMSADVWDYVWKRTRGIPLLLSLMDKEIRQFDGEDVGIDTVQDILSDDIFSNCATLLTDGEDSLTHREIEVLRTLIKMSLDPDIPKDGFNEAIFEDDYVQFVSEQCQTELHVLNLYEDEHVVSLLLDLGLIPSGDGEEWLDSIVAIDLEDPIVQIFLRIEMDPVI